MTEAPRWLIPFYMALNFTTSVLIIWANKIAFNAGFNFTVSLTTLHFTFTFVGLEIGSRYGLFDKKALSIISVVPISLAFCGFVVFNNLSLQYNAVGIYQLLKVLTTPTIIVLQHTLYKQVLPFWQIISLVPVCVGVALATVTSIEVNFWGLVFGGAGIISTSLYQIWVKKEQESLQCTSPQLLYYQSAVSGVMLCCLVPFMEPLVTDKDGNPGLLLFDFTPWVTFWILTSAALAFLVNLSIFLVIGKTSPISYNVLGHGKLTCILLSGYLVFGQEATWKNITGVIMTLIGIFWYTHLKLQAASEPKQSKSPHQQNKLVNKDGAHKEERELTERDHSNVSTEAGSPLANDEELGGSSDEDTQMLIAHHRGEGGISPHGGPGREK